MSVGSLENTSAEFTPIRGLFTNTTRFKYIAGIFISASFARLAPRQGEGKVFNV